MLRTGFAFLARIAALGCLALSLSACGTTLTREPVPANLLGQAHPLGLPGLRAWGDVVDATELRRFIDHQADIMRERYGPLILAGGTPTLHYLAISGGGPDGAFGSGVLSAWTKTGTRPDFFGVSGVSTGSMIAPFAFLGPEYDGMLEEMYTSLKTDDVLSPTLFSGVFSGTALTDTSGLAKKIAQYVTPEMLEKIAVEFRRGRLLLVGTTYLDTGRPMIWNMGAIAASGHPGALELFRDVIRASAAVPIAFPPVFIKVQTADGKTYDEMHVDGGATSQVVLVSPQIPIGALTRQRLGRNIDRRLWVLVNNKVLTEYDPVRPRLAPVGGAAVSALIRGSGVGDMYKLFLVSERDEIAFNAAWIPQHTPCEDPGEMFDPKYMRCLFDFGAEQQRGGKLWSNLPPYYIRAPELPPMPQPALMRRAAQQPRR